MMQLSLSQRMHIARTLLYAIEAGENIATDKDVGRGIPFINGIPPQLRGKVTLVDNVFTVTKDNLELHYDLHGNDIHDPKDNENILLKWYSLEGSQALINAVFDRDEALRDLTRLLQDYDTLDGLEIPEVEVTEDMVEELQDRLQPPDVVVAYGPPDPDINGYDDEDVDPGEARWLDDKRQAWADDDEVEVVDERYAIMKALADLLAQTASLIHKGLEKLDTLD